MPTFLQPAGLYPAQGYSHAVVTEGRTLHVAGQVAQDEAGDIVGVGDFGAQTRRALLNLERALAAAGVGS